jgi:hypothetical protein
MPDMYKLGVSDALARLGLIDRDNDLRDTLVAGAAASPFLGYVGQRRFKTSPYAGTAAATPPMSVHDLMQHAQPGDLVVTREGKLTPFRRVSELITGSPLHHVEPVVGKKDVYFGTTADVAEHATPQGQVESVKAQVERAPTVGARAQAKNYEDLVLLRPKKPGDVPRFVNRAVLESRKPYSYSRAVSSALKDIFMPKLPYVTDRPVVCSGHTCSTLTGEALRAATGERAPVIAGKSVGELLPADFLRSGRFEMVGHTVPGSTAARLRRGQQAALRALGARAALGLGLAGTTYGLSEEPEAAAAVGGAALTPMLARRIAGKGKKGERVIRPFRHLLNVLQEQGSKARAIRRNVLGRSLPLALGGGLAAYLAAKGIRGATEA